MKIEFTGTIEEIFAQMVKVFNATGMKVVPFEQEEVKAAPEPDPVRGVEKEIEKRSRGRPRDRDPDACRFFRLRRKSRQRQADKYRGEPDEFGRR